MRPTSPPTRDTERPDTENAAEDVPIPDTRRDVRPCARSRDRRWSGRRREGRRGGRHGTAPL